MAFVAGVPLAAAVCKAGGLGMIGVAAMPPDELRRQIGAIRSATNRAFGIDIIARFSPPEHIEVLEAEKAPLAVFFWDAAPEGWIGRLQAVGAKVWTCEALKPKTFSKGLDRPHIPYHLPKCEIRKEAVGCAVLPLTNSPHANP